MTRQKALIVFLCESIPKKESIYAVVFLDAIHFHVRSEGQIVKKAVYIAIGIDLDGKKDWSRIHAQLSVYFDDRMPD